MNSLRKILQHILRGYRRHVIMQVGQHECVIRHVSVTATVMSNQNRHVSQFEECEGFCRLNFKGVKSDRVWSVSRL